MRDSEMVELNIGGSLYLCANQKLALGTVSELTARRYLALNYSDGGSRIYGDDGVPVGYKRISLE